MSRLLASRDAITAALTAGGVRWATDGKLAAPAVLVEPGDPWAGPATLRGRRTARWQLTAAAGKPDAGGALETLAELVDTVDAALLAAQVQLPTWSKMRTVELAGMAQAASVATVEHMTEEV